MKRLRMAVQTGYIFRRWAYVHVVEGCGYKPGQRLMLVVAEDVREPKMYRRTTLSEAWDESPPNSAIRAGVEVVIFDDDQANAWLRGTL